MSEICQNYHYVKDNAVVIITAISEEEAEGILKDTVKYPEEFGLENVTSVN